MADQLIEAHNQLVTGLHEAWLHLATRYPRNRLDRSRVHESPGPYAPRYDPEVERIYVKAQRALAFAYDRAVTAGVRPFWTGRSSQARRLVDPEVLVSVSTALIRHVDQGDPEQLALDLATVAKILRPFWREPGIVVDLCVRCGEHPQPKQRRTCWRCTNGRRRSKVVLGR